jgi:hypothetical protein
MESSFSRQQRQKLFAWVLLGCIVLAVGSIYRVIQRDNTSPVLPESLPQGTLLPLAGPGELTSIQNGPHLLFINQEVPYTGKVKLVELGSSSPRQAQTALVCDRVHYAAGTGICLSYDEEHPDVLVWVTLFGPDFQPRHRFKIDGVLSRARVSPDGKYATATVFVNGHSYADANMSTATILIDTATGANLGNLEEFETWKDGSRYQAPEFNFWGVTFAQDSNHFYATLRHGDKTYLVQGDVTARKLTVLHENVECPSLSPDGTRIAFKKLTSRGT